MTDSMTPERLAEIAARVEAATDGPWRRWNHPMYGDVCAVETAWSWDDDGADTEVVAEQCSPSDADLIAHAPKDLADLHAEVERLQAQVERVRDALLASDDGTEHEHEDGCKGQATCPACWVDTIRRALDGEVE